MCKWTHAVLTHVVQESVVLHNYTYMWNLFLLAVTSLSCSTRDLHRGMQDLSLGRSGSSLQHKLLSSCGVQVFLFSRCGAQVPGFVGSVVVAHRVSS